MRFGADPESPYEKSRRKFFVKRRALNYDQCLAPIPGPPGDAASQPKPRHTLMPGPEFHPDGQPDSSRYESDAEKPPAPPGPSGIDSSLLEEVLRRTLETAESLDAFEASDLKPLLEVAERHRGRPLELDPVTVDLVDAALRDYFRQGPGGMDEWRQIARRIAETLFEDPAAHGRMEVFWNRLSAVRR